MSSINTRVAKWISGDDTGMSSQAICAHMLSDEAIEIQSHAYPRDPSDLGRCLRLLAIIPEWSGRIHEMRSHGAYWSALVDHWDEMAQAMADEVGIDWSKGRSAPKTYALMKFILDPVTEADLNVVVIGRGVTMRTTF